MCNSWYASLRTGSTSLSRQFRFRSTFDSFWRRDHDSPRAPTDRDTIALLRTDKRILIDVSEFAVYVACVLRTISDVLLAATVILPAAGGLATLRPAGGSGRIAVRATAVACAFGVVVVAGSSLDRFPSWSLNDRLLVEVDPLGALLLVFVLASTLVVQSFAVRSLRGDVARARFFAASGCAATATAMVAVAADLWVLVAAWILVSVATIALLRHDGRPGAAAASRRAATSFMIGDAALVLAAIAASATVGAVTLRPQSMNELAMSDAQVFGAVGITGLLAAAAVIAAICRCAQPPSQNWLPMSVASPTPSSALLHAGIVNGGGVVLIRFAPVVGVSTIATGVALASGCAGVLIGAAVSRTRADVKSGLAWSTVAQMGFMVVQCVTGLFGPALIHMVAHGMYKSNLFLGSGSAVAHRHSPSAGRTSLFDRVVRALGVGVVTAVALGVAWVVVRPTSFEGAAGLVLLGFVIVTVAQLTSAWLRTRDERTSLDLLAFAALVLATTASLAVAGAIKKWLAPSLSEVEPTLAAVGAVALGATALAGWSIGAFSRSGSTTAGAVAARAYLWAAHLGDPARVTPPIGSSEVRP